MAREKRAPTITNTFRLPPETDDQITELAAHYKQPKGEVIASAIAFAHSTLKKKIQRTEENA